MIIVTKKNKKMNNHIKELVLFSCIFLPIVVPIAIFEKDYLSITVYLLFFIYIFFKYYKIENKDNFNGTQKFDEENKINENRIISYFKYNIFLNKHRNLPQDVLWYLIIIFPIFIITSIIIGNFYILLYLMVICLFYLSLDYFIEWA